MSTPNPASTPWVPLWDTGAGPAGARSPGSIPGEIKLWAGTALPDPTKYGKWVWADGASYVAATYPEASANIDTRWKTFGGAADPGAGNFRVPDMRGLVPCGLDQMPGGTRANRVTRAAAITNATSTGEEYHTLTIAETAAHTHGGATGAEAAHTHSGTTGVENTGHVHYANAASGTFNGWPGTVTLFGGSHGHNLLLPAASGSGGVGSVGTQNSAGGSALSTDAPNHSHPNSDFGNYVSGNHVQHVHAFTTGAGTSHSHSISSQGGGGSHENLPPTVFVPYIVRLDG